MHWFWGYVHIDSKPRLKRWFGDVRDYTEDCDNNPFVIKVVKPFQARTEEEARRILFMKLHCKDWRE